MRKISLLITDLDNTLYDWVGSFVPAFYAMVDEAALHLKVNHEILLDELKRVHQQHGSAEHPFALLETETVNRALRDKTWDEKRAILDPAFHAFNTTRKSTLKLYDGVADTLATIRNSGTIVVAYTDARVPNSMFRINRLGLDQYISKLYAPAQIIENARITEFQERDLRMLQALPSNDRKPNPNTLLDICRNYEIDPTKAVYVGDSLSRDIFMAERAGTHSAWAKYGTQVDALLWKRLVRVTHWTDEDVRREEILRVLSSNTKAEVTLDNFSDLLLAFQFAPN